MKTQRVECARADLLRIFVRLVAPDISNVTASIDQHCAPRDQGLLIKWRHMDAMDICNEFRGLCRASAALVGELPVRGHD